MPVRWFRWPLRNSLPAKLALIVFVFVGAVALVRGLSLDRLTLADLASTEVRNRWLDTLRLLDRLHDLTSDVRAAEAEILLGPDPRTRDQRQHQLRDLIARAGAEIDRYRTHPKDPDEKVAFGNFVGRWDDYLLQADATRALSQGGQQEQAVALFNGGSRSSFQAAAAALEQTVGITEARAQAARNTAVQAMESAQDWISDLIIGTLVLFAVIAIYLWWSVSRPLLDLGRLMRRLASYDTSFAIPSDRRRDEIGEMARALGVFRRNTIELLESRKSLSTQAEVLARSLDKERALAREQRNFITTASHELRTPLTAIDGHAQRLIATKERARPPEIADRAEKIRAAAFRMTSIVASLTDTLEFAQRDVRTRLRSIDLDEMLRGLVRYYREIGLATALEEDIGPLPRRIAGDPELLYQVFSNLLSNAFKYSPDGAIVRLKAEAMDVIVEITVEDQGVGIPRDELGRVRERYFRASNVGTIPGTGMGLYLVDEIVRQHGGQVDIDSEEGRGTRVSVILPAGNAAERADD